MKVQLICMACDGTYVREGDFATVAEAWEHSNDMGSRWYFYPFHFVLTASGKTVKDAPEVVSHFIGKRIETVQRAFEQLSNEPEMADANYEEFIFAL